MRLLRIVTILLFIVTVVAGIMINGQKEITADTTYPEITADSDEIQVSLQAEDEELLQGLTAHDEKDGDLTSEIVVEKLSYFSEPGTCSITYAVSDMDNHVTRYTRKLQYEDYESPKFSLNEPLIFHVGSTANVADCVGAQDVLDGDISENVSIVSSNLNTSEAGVYEIGLRVANSRGDAQELLVHAYVREKVSSEAQIELSEYMVYKKLGENLNAEFYIDKVWDNYGTDRISKDQVQVNDDEVQMDTPGVYYVTYTVKGTEEDTGMTILTVVVRE